MNETSIILASALDSALLFSVEVMSKAYGIDMLGTVAKPATPEAIEALIKLYKPPQTRHQLDAIMPVFTLPEILHGFCHLYLVRKIEISRLQKQWIVQDAFLK